MFLIFYQDISTPRSFPNRSSDGEVREDVLAAEK